mmetsp:Transcript_23705/g.74585  ORF Transcript_23705/g.74585 Transcript_23705/m.74585 type:complete len:288 (+) Transcript_23705:45-908(+)
MGNGPSATCLDPLVGCCEGEDAPAVPSSAAQGNHRPSTRRIRNSTLLRQAEDEELLQDAILRSLNDTGPSDDPELQEALHQSCLTAAGIAGEQPQEVAESAKQLEALLKVLGLQRLDVGSTNLSEGGTILSNQCFYLAIARSWLADAAKGGGMLIRDSALQLKRDIEANVLDVRGVAAQRDLGEENEAYTDYLACAMQGQGPCAGVVADLAIAVFASCSGTLEAYEGSGYSQLPRSERVANLALIWHRSGHFEAVVAAENSGKADLTLEELLKEAERAEIPTAAVQA